MKYFMLLLISTPLAHSDQRVLPHIVSGGGWTTTISTTNLLAEPQISKVRFFDKDGAPSKLHLVGGHSLTEVERTLLPWQTAHIQLDGGTTISTTGFAYISSDVERVAYTVTLKDPLGRESSYALQSNEGCSTIIPFSGLNDAATALAFVNANLSTATYTIALRSDYGDILGHVTRTMKGWSQETFVLQDLFPHIVSGIGSIRISTGWCTTIPTIGFRLTPKGMSTLLPFPSIYRSNHPWGTK